MKRHGESKSNQIFGCWCYLWGLKSSQMLSLVWFKTMQEIGGESTMQEHVPCDAKIYCGIKSKILQMRRLC